METKRTKQKHSKYFWLLTTDVSANDIIVFYDTLVTKELQYTGTNGNIWYVLRLVNSKVIFFWEDFFLSRRFRLRRYHLKRFLSKKFLTRRFHSRRSLSKRFLLRRYLLRRFHLRRLRLRRFLSKKFLSKKFLSRRFHSRRSLSRKFLLQDFFLDDCLQYFFGEGRFIFSRRSWFFWEDLDIKCSSVSETPQKGTSIEWLILLPVDLRDSKWSEMNSVNLLDT